MATGVAPSANLAPAPGSPIYEKAQQDLGTLSPDVAALGIAYARYFDVPERLIIALLMQEQPIYARSWQWVKKLAKEATYAAGALGRGHGGDVSAGVVQMKAFTARSVLIEAGYESIENDGLRSLLINDDEFAVAVSVLHLKLDLEAGMTAKQSYLAYSLDTANTARLLQPGDALV